MTPRPRDWFFALGQMGALVGGNLLLLQAWIPHFFGLWNDGGSWSIAAEAFFYALFPLILPVLARSSPRTWWQVAAACCLLSFLPEWIYILFQQPQPAATFYSMPIFPAYVGHNAVVLPLLGVVLRLCLHADIAFAVVLVFHMLFCAEWRIVSIVCCAVECIFLAGL